MSPKRYVSFDVPHQKPLYVADTHETHVLPIYIPWFDVPSIRIRIQL
jgi:hypothetical protein